MSRLPVGWDRAATHGSRILARRESLDFVRSAVTEAGSLHAYAEAHALTVAHSGRGAAHVVTGPDGAWVVRHYRRGGGMAWLVDRYLRAAGLRPFAELHASDAARARGVNTPEVMAAVVYPAGAFYRADIATRCIENAEALGALTFGTAPWPEPERVEAWRAAGSLMRHALERGVVHADLNLDNVLVERDGTPWLIDLDRCRVLDRADAASRERVLRRFDRSLRKHERRAARPLGEPEQHAFLEGLAE